MHRWIGKHSRDTHGERVLWKEPQSLKLLFRLFFCPLEPQVLCLWQPGKPLHTQTHTCTCAFTRAHTFSVLSQINTAHVYSKKLLTEKKKGGVKGTRKQGHEWILPTFHFHTCCYLCSPNSIHSYIFFTFNFALTFFCFQCSLSLSLSHWLTPWPCRLVSNYGQL